MSEMLVIARKYAKLVAYILCILVIAYIILRFLNIWVGRQIAQHYVERLHQYTGISSYLAEALTVVLALLLAFALYWMFSFSRFQRVTAYGIIVLIMAGTPVAIHIFSERHYFPKKGGEILYRYTISQEGKIRIFRGDVYNDPQTGKKTKPLTPEIAQARYREDKGLIPSKLNIERLEDIELFDKVTGAPKVWYCWNKVSNKYDLFDKPGYHPITRVPLFPVTPGVAQKIVQQIKIEIQQHEKLEKEKQEQIARTQVQKRIYNKKLKYLAGLLPPGQKTTKKCFGMMITNKNGKLSHKIMVAVQAELRKRKITSRIQVFSKAFQSEGEFEKAFRGNLSTLNIMDLGDAYNYIVFGITNSKFTDNPSLEGVITCVTSLNLKIIKIRPLATEYSFIISQKSATFSRDSALKENISKMASAVAKRLRKTLPTNDCT